MHEIYLLTNIDHILAYMDTKTCSTNPSEAVYDNIGKSMKIKKSTVFSAAILFSSTQVVYADTTNIDYMNDCTQPTFPFLEPLEPFSPTVPFPEPSPPKFPSHELCELLMMSNNLTHGPIWWDPPSICPNPRFCPWTDELPIPTRPMA